MSINLKQSLYIWTRMTCVEPSTTLVFSGQLALEHVDHALEGAGSTDLSHEIVQLRLGHENTNVVEGATQVILVQGAVLVDVHQLEAVLVHLDLLLGEASLFILSLAHDELLLLT